ncbi:MAG: Mur ligase [Pseudomonadota bacterium]
MPLSDQLRACFDHVSAECTALPAPYPAYALFFSVSDGSRRAHVVQASGPDLQTAWNEGVTTLRAWLKDASLGALWLRVDWVEGARAVSWERLGEQLALTKRNYFRQGLAMDESFRIAFTEQELNANAMLYGGATIDHAMVNAKNFRVYARQRFGADVNIDIPPGGPVYLLATRGVFCKSDGVVHALGASGLNAGRREVPTLAADDVLDMVRSASSFLARQVKPSGLFVYGYFPCFDRPIPTYNTLRHASTLYSMIEAWELTREPTLKAAIDRSIEHLTSTLIRIYKMPDGHELAFLVDTGDEIKLGGNAVCLLALVKYSEAMDTHRWQPLLEKLALGILRMQHDNGRFDHVLNASDLSLKQATRIVYYDGEAAFGLMRLYALTRDARWLMAVEKAFGYFIGNEHWRAHDHWLSYCVNELTRWRPEEKYFRFGLLNVVDHLDFVLERKTTFPTLLELMLAANQMVQRLQQMPEMAHLLEMVDMDKFHRALEHRAGYLLNGFFWPEFAMYFKNPQLIEGSFFIRHQSFRVRIDDVEHYLSGFVNYHRVLKARAVAASTATPAKGASGLSAPASGSGSVSGSESTQRAISA